LRRDHYAFGDILEAPFMINEVSSNENLHMRMPTSFIRYNTVLHHPIIGVEYEQQPLNQGAVIRHSIRFALNSLRVTVGRRSTNAHHGNLQHYQPVGYVISQRQLREDEETGRLHASDAQRQRERLVLSHRLRDERRSPGDRESD
jgi:hypothetical protein